MYFLFTKESIIVEISTCWENILDFSLDCFHSNQTNVCSLSIVFSRKKNVISDSEPYLQEFYLKNTEDMLAHDGCVNDPCVILSKYSYQFKQ